MGDLLDILQNFVKISMAFPSDSNESRGIGLLRELLSRSSREETEDNEVNGVMRGIAWLEEKLSSERGQQYLPLVADLGMLFFNQEFMAGSSCERLKIVIRIVKAKHPHFMRKEQNSENMELE